jgi:hypothetical protein
VYGVEHGDTSWDQEKMELVEQRVPREPALGLRIQASELGDADVFRVHEFRARILCTDRVRDHILERGYSNVDFFEMGDVLE